LEVSVVDNPRWREGLSRSVRCAAEAAAGFDALLLTLADQPRVTTGVLDRLIGVAEREARDLVACSYAETLGAPALFGSRYFEDLRTLDGDRGAKSVLERHAGEVAAIPVADAALDLDTPADLARRSSAARSGDPGSP
ncbi:MAG: NTP transferase domain-containing protein, partial [Myxococcota bacterium]|nr:NTP transferase domain-containing protein [Myxococcota bacterium]